MYNQSEMFRKNKMDCCLFLMFAVSDTAPDSKQACKLSYEHGRRFEEVAEGVIEEVDERDAIEIRVPDHLTREERLPRSCKPATPKQSAFFDTAKMSLLGTQQCSGTHRF